MLVYFINSESNAAGHRTAEDCGVVPNTASVVTTNDGDDTDDATVTIQCPALTITKEPDAGDVPLFPPLPHALRPMAGAGRTPWPVR